MPLLGDIFKWLVTTMIETKIANLQQQETINDNKNNNRKVKKTAIFTKKKNHNIKTSKM